MAWTNGFNATQYVTLEIRKKANKIKSQIMVESLFKSRNKITYKEISEIIVVKGDNCFVPVASKWLASRADLTMVMTMTTIAT